MVCPRITSIAEGPQTFTVTQPLSSSRTISRNAIHLFFCKFHRQRIGTCNGTFEYRYDPVWFEIMNACHVHDVNMLINHYQSLFGFFSSYRELGRCCNNIINNIIATKNSIDSHLVAFKNRRRGRIPWRVISANKIHFRG